MKKYKYVGDYEEAHRKVKLIPGEIVELPDVPPRLQSWLVPVTEEVPAKVVEPTPVVEEPVAPVKKVTRRKKRS